VNEEYELKSLTIPAQAVRVVAGALLFKDDSKILVVSDVQEPSYVL
jgi:hypothetical protein